MTEVRVDLDSRKENPPAVDDNPATIEGVDQSPEQDKSCIRQFLRTAFPDLPEGYQFCVFAWNGGADSTSEARFFGSTDEASDAIVELGKSRNVALSMGLYSTETAVRLARSGGRGTAFDVGGIIGAWVDLDLKTANKGNGFDSESHVRQFLARLPWEPTLLTHSGHGFHAYFMFIEPWIFTGGRDHLSADAFLCNFGRTMRFHAGEMGVKIDPVFDLARVMRVAGTVNRGKPGCLPVVSHIMHDSDITYGRDELQAYFLETDCIGDADAKPSRRHRQLEAELAGRLAPDESMSPTEQQIADLRHRSCRFKQIWEGEIPEGLHDTSPSGLCMSAACSAAIAGWAEPELLSLLVALRKRLGADLKLENPGSYGKTIAKALVRAEEWRERNTTEQLETRTELLEFAKAGDTMALTCRLDDLVEQPQPVRDFILSKLPSKHAKPLQTQITAAFRRRTVERDERAKVDVANLQQGEVVLQIASALAEANSPPVLFAHDSRLSRLERTAGGIRRIVALEATAAVDLISRSILLVRSGLKGPEVVERNDPAWIQGLLGRTLNDSLLREGHRSFPVIQGVVTHPVLRGDMSVLTTPGYDKQSGLFLDITEAVPVPENPARQDAERAAGQLDDVIGDFPFASEADRSNTIGLMLTTLIRESVTLAPLAIIDAPERGSGKTLLARAIFAVFLGQDPAKDPVPSNEEEARKRITSVVLEGRRYALLDNADRSLAIGHSSLARLMTSANWSDRILSSSATVNAKNSLTIILTGNNVQLAGDMGRRSYRIRLNGPSLQPREYQFPDLIREAINRRIPTAVSLLTMIRAWIVAGKPPCTTPVLPTFEPWSTMVGGVLEYAGVRGFLSNRVDSIGVDDPELDELTEALDFLHLNYQGRPFSAVEAAHAFLRNNNNQQALPEKIQRQCRATNVQVCHISRSLAKWLTANIDRVIRSRRRPEHRLQLRVERGSDRNRYWVQVISNPRECEAPAASPGLPPAPLPAA